MAENIKVVQLKDPTTDEPISPVVNIGSLYANNGKRVENLVSYTLAGTDVTIPEIPNIKDEIKAELDYIPSTEKGAASGVAPLGVDGLLALTFGGLGANTAFGARRNLEVAKPVREEVTFLASGWNLSGNVYTQTVTCSVAKNIMKYANVGIKYSTDVSTREQERDASKYIAYIDTLDGQLIATCWSNEKPQINLTYIFEGGIE